VEEGENVLMMGDESGSAPEKIRAFGRERHFQSSRAWQSAVRGRFFTATT
jgi:hypothetical protein